MNISPELLLTEAARPTSEGRLISLAERMRSTGRDNPPPAPLDAGNEPESNLIEEMIRMIALQAFIDKMRNGEEEETGMPPALEAW